MRNGFKILVEKPKGKRLFGTNWGGNEDNIRMNLQVILLRIVASSGLLRTS
jgi:hypothetical protein